MDKFELHLDYYGLLSLHKALLEANFKEEFEWKKLDGWDIEWLTKCPHCGKTLRRISSEDYMYECSKCQTLFSKDLKDSLELN